MTPTVTVAVLFEVVLVLVNLRYLSDLWLG